MVDLSDSFLNVSNSPTSECENDAPACPDDEKLINSPSYYKDNTSILELQPDHETLTLSVDREQLIREQRNDATLSTCFTSVKSM